MKNRNMFNLFAPAKFDPSYQSKVNHTQSANEEKWLQITNSSLSRIKSQKIRWDHTNRQKQCNSQGSRKILIRSYCI